MFLTVTTTHQPATDLGFLLHKHPEKAQAFEVSAGTAHVFYPVATETECTAALLLEIDPIELVRGQRHDSLTQYVNDRPYAASSMLAVALAHVFRTALNGRCDQRPELAKTPIPLQIHVPALPARGGVETAQRLFEPLGWQVEATALPLDPKIPDWGESRYLDLRLTGEVKLSDALKHLYVLIPVLDNSKHYWVGESEVDKLLRAGEGWLSSHPEQEFISRRYLAHRKGYVRSALERLAEADDADPDELDDAVTETPEEPEKPEPLAQQRRGSVLAALKATGARRVLDLGCGSGALLLDLVKEPSFTEILGADVSSKALDMAERRLGRLPERQRERVRLRQTALTYVDSELAGYDAAVLMEVIEHLDANRLPALERAVFGAAKPQSIVVTTPNVEYNALFEGMPEGALRHSDHRFEWSRAEFRAWAEGVAARNGYAVRFLPVGPEDPDRGSPTQLAVFTQEVCS